MIELRASQLNLKFSPETNRESRLNERIATVITWNEVASRVWQADVASFQLHVKINNKNALDMGSSKEIIIYIVSCEDTTTNWKRFSI